MRFISETRILFPLLLRSILVSRQIVENGWCWIGGVVFWRLLGRCVVFLHRRLVLFNLTVSFLDLGLWVVAICGVLGLYSLGLILLCAGIDNSNLFPTPESFPPSIPLWWRIFSATRKLGVVRDVFGSIWFQIYPLPVWNLSVMFCISTGIAYVGMGDSRMVQGGIWVYHVQSSCLV